jgi:hypothetical protein
MIFARFARFLVIAAATALITSTAYGQSRPNTRQGFWFNIGLGAGSLGCDDCDTRTNGLSGQLSLGGTISPRFLLGVSSNGWTKSEDGVTLTMGALTTAFRFYPSATGAFYLTGGLGLATLDLGVEGYGSESEMGVAALLGLGYDIRVGDSISLTPFWNGIGGSFHGGGANFGQIGLSITWH